MTTFDAHLSRRPLMQPIQLAAPVFLAWFVSYSGEGSRVIPLTVVECDADQQADEGPLSPDLRADLEEARAELRRGGGRSDDEVRGPR